MSNNPNSQLDVIAQDVSQLKQDVAQLTRRLKDFDVTILKILQTFKRGEEAFELRVARVLRNTLGGIVDNLDQSINAHAEAISQLERGFDIYPVDGETVKENAQTILVRKRDDGEYDYSKASDPDTIINEGCGPFSKFFNDNPSVFGDRKQLLVNIVAYSTKKQLAEEATDHGEG